MVQDIWARWLIFIHDDIFGYDANTAHVRVNVSPENNKGFDMKVELKKIKVSKMMSKETTAFEADLWIDGKKAASIHNNGSGGSNSYYFEDKATEQKFFAFCNSLPPIPSEYFPNGMPMDEEIVVGNLLEKHEHIQKLKRMTKTKTLVKLADHKFAEWTIYMVVYTPQIGQELRKKHGADLVAIANENIENAANL